MTVVRVSAYLPRNARHHRGGRTVGPFRTLSAGGAEGCSADKSGVRRSASGREHWRATPELATLLGD